uniref:FecR domain-containing protein n=1 Tax=Roseihalotalea indica TaxID=2867963 RepID=A0AA49JJ18_9BACT|nr:FecR domain-containing protein [Tunicatimonas sp. TK19036]
MNYQNYNTEDFLLDKNFRDWVENPDEDLNSFWNQYLQDHPEKREEVDQAREILQKMKFKKHTLSTNEVDGVWNNILQGKAKGGFRQPFGEPVLSVQSEPAGTLSHTNIVSRRKPLMIAASMALAFIVAGLLVWPKLRTHEEVYTTTYGETMTVALADGSVATLNANSSLRVPTDWSDTKAREVWLEGEAFFQVRRVSQNDNLSQEMPVKFLVHTQGVAVEVLGTQFNVNTRREKVQVVLNSGKVRLKLSEKEVLMSPGELVEVSGTEQEVSQRMVKPETYSSWKDNRLLCDTAPLGELAHTIEDRFGYEVVFMQDDLSDIKVSGTIPLDSIETFNLVISRLINANFEIKGDKVLISK